MHHFQAPFVNRNAEDGKRIVQEIVFEREVRCDAPPVGRAKYWARI
jgi:hypothetical protein